MKTIAFPYALILILFFNPPMLKAQQLPDYPVDSIKNLLGEFPTQTQFALAIIQDDTVSYYGYILEQEGIKEIENSNKVFEIGSITKVFTSELLLRAANEKKVILEHPIKKYLKKIKLKDKSTITLQQLSNHSSGLPRMPENSMLIARNNPLNPYQQYGEEELIDYLEHWMEAKTTPGEQYAYSNLGAGLLAYILCQKEKKSFEELLQSKILGPLQMHQTTTKIDKIKNQLVKGFDAKGTEVPNWEFNALAGAGALFSSTSDLSKWVRRNFDKDPILDEQRSKTMEVSEKLDMAYGWHIIKKQTKEPLYFHNGGTGGYHSFLVFEPNSKSAVILLTNVSAFHPNASKIDRQGLELIKFIIEVI